ncbi:hypothetical protein [Geodermatophilus tzadiensis]|uniref:hypothetical protein n=1 Tax=Geodermatophilus tzadiensis TaxID=1137988 RepID=UPI0011B28639|nr:hypothetical protein [Geodermatophilus tzadiensis]
MRKFIVISAACMSLVACEQSPEESALETLREVPLFAASDDETLLELMRSSCETLKTDGALGYLSQATDAGLTGDQAGILLGEALELYCPNASEMNDPLFGDR